jgi:hypothetical protein
MQMAFGGSVISSVNSCKTYINVAWLSETHLEPHVRFFIPNYHYRTGRKSPGHAWNDADIIELLSVRQKSLLAGDLNAKHPLWNSVVSNPSGLKLLNLI